MSTSPTQHTDVIFVVEGTALCGAYLHDLRSQYIIPTLEHFSGSIDEKDCGSDSNYCLFGLVVFHAADILPGFLVNSTGPLNTSYKLLNQIDKIRFAGGHGEALAHVGEGLATALECLENLSEFRSNLTDVQAYLGVDVIRFIATKHVILICNCKPYGLPVSESEGTDERYVGKSAEQLAVLMNEQGIHLTIMSPRKIPALIQLFDHAGGDMTMQKGYARDTRHLILLSGYSLKERPPSPVRSSQEPSFQTIMAPLTPQGSQTPGATGSGSGPPSQQSVTSTAVSSAQASVQQSQSLIALAQHQQPMISQSPTMMQLPRSPASGGPMSGTPPQQNIVSTGVQAPPTQPQNKMQHLTPQQQQQVMQLQQQQQQLMQQQQMGQFRNPRPQVPGQMGNARGALLAQQQMNQQLNAQAQQQQQQQNLGINQGVPNQQQLAQQQHMKQQQMLQQQQQQMAQQQQQQLAQQQQQQALQQQQQQALQQQQQQAHQQQAMQQQQRWPNQQQMTPQQQQMAAQQQQLNQQQSRMQMPGQNQIPHPQQTGSPSPLQRPPQEILARLNQPPIAPSPVLNTNPSQPQLQQIPGPGQLIQQQQNIQRERRIIWSGFLEWHEKPKGSPEGQKIPRQVPCQVSANVTNNEPEVKGDGWPSKLIMQLIPKGIVGNLGGTYFLDVKTVLFMLQNCDALASLTKVMDSGFAGCVHFTGSGMPQATCTIKVLILLYSKERHAYLGFIPNDQAGFVDRIRKVIQQQKSQQAVLRQGGGAGPIPNNPPGFGTQPSTQGGGIVMQAGMAPGQQPQQQLGQNQGQVPVTVQQLSSQSQPITPQTHVTTQLQQQLAAVSQLQSSTSAAAAQSSSGPELDRLELERQQNVLKIQQLQQALEQAQQRELQFQQLQSHPGQPSGPGQMGQMPMHGQMGGPGQGQQMQGQNQQLQGQNQQMQGQGQQMQGQNQQMQGQGQQMQGQTQQIQGQTQQIQGQNQQIQGQNQQIQGQNQQMQGQNQQMQSQNQQMQGQGQMGGQGQGQPMTGHVGMSGGQGQPGPRQQMMPQQQQMQQMQRMIRPSVGQANPGLKHLLQQQPSSSVGQSGGFRGMGGMQRMPGQQQQQQQQMVQQMQQINQQGSSQQFEDVGILDLLK